MSVKLKICGLSEPETLRAAVQAGADWIGFVFFEQSPRNVTLAAAESLLLGMGTAAPVGLMVDPDDVMVRDVLGLGIRTLQLHGSETPARVREIQVLGGVDEVWKAIGVASKDDLAFAETYADVADRLLLDAKPPSKAAVPGGAGEAFDWALLKDWTAPMPWLLAGGLTPENVQEAITATGARAVDVSSGVERARGLKSAQKIREFIAAAKQP
jgi:phosphoribosylanthranilate isomerase